MQRTLQRLKTISREDSFAVSVDSRHHVSSLANLLCKIEHSMLEVRDMVLVANDLGLDPPATTALVDEMLVAAESTRKIHCQLQQLELGGVYLPFITLCEIFLNQIVLKLTSALPAESDIIKEAERHRDDIFNLVSDWLLHYPMLHFLLKPLLRWLRDEVLVPLQISNRTSGSNSSQVEELIGSLLACVQSIASRCSHHDKKDDSRKYLLDGYLLSRDLTHLLCLDTIRDKLESVFSAFSSYATLKESFSTVGPLLDLYTSLALDQLSFLTAWTKTLFKLSFVLCSLLKSLSQQGFCRPVETDEAAATDTATSDHAEGTGIGEGSGGESVSKEIEDGSQIEGLQDQGKEEEDVARKNEADPDAIEMTEDFGGELEDRSEVGDDDQSSLEEPEFDETLEDLDGHDPSATNERIRDTSETPRDSDGHDGKVDESHSTKQTESSEMTAKEDKDSKKRGDSGEGTEEDIMHKEMDLEDDHEDPHVDGGPMEQVPEADTLDLPDNINLDEKDGKEGDLDVGEDGELCEDQDDNLPEGMVTEDTEDRGTLGNDSEEMDEETLGRTQVEPDEVKFGENDIQDLSTTYPDISSGGGKADPEDILHPETRKSELGGIAGSSQNVGISTQEGEDQDTK